MQTKFMITFFLLIMLSALAVMAEELPDNFVFPQETAGPQIGTETIPESAMLAQDGMLFLVNREQKASKAYIPADLVLPRVGTRKKGMEERILMRREAALALEEMFFAAKKEAKFTLYAASGYRSFGIQQILFNGKAEEKGKESANKTVAIPGSSEHQLGLAMDVQAPSLLNLNRSFGDTQEGQWVAQNAHRFGFIIRYKKEWTDVTGYAYEPWHLRYIGLAHARALYALDMPYEHYHDIIKAWPEYILRGASDLLLIGLVKERLIDPTLSLPLDLLNAGTDSQKETALRAATVPYLPQGSSYEQVLWAIYPTPKPTAGPRIDEDEETSLFSAAIHGLAH